MEVPPAEAAGVDQEDPPKDAFGPRGKSPAHHHHHHHNLYSSPALISNCAGLHQPAGSRALRTPGAPDQSLTNSEKCETWEVGRWESSHWEPFGNLRSSPVLRGPAGTQNPYLPRGLLFSVFCLFSGFVLFFFFFFSSLLIPPPGSPEPTVSLSRSTPTQSRLALSSPAESPSPPSTTFCQVSLHGYAVMEEKKEIPAVPKASPQRAGQGEKMATGVRAERREALQGGSILR